MSKNKLEIEPKEAKKKLTTKEAIFVDVRTPREREVAVIEPGLFVPLDELAKKMKTLPTDKLLVVYCHHGNRSLFAAQVLSQKGFKTKSLAGGIDKWAKEIDSTITTY